MEGIWYGDCVMVDIAEVKQVLGWLVVLKMSVVGQDQLVMVVVGINVSERNKYRRISRLRSPPRVPLT